MRKILVTLFVCACSLKLFAQGEIQFTILKSAQEELPQSVVEALDLRLRQVFNRNSAAAANQYNVFAIEPEFELSDVLTTEGLMQEVSMVKGELTLTAKNSVDGTMYYSMTIPVKGSGVGGDEKAMKAMVANIKSTDVKFTRFIRIARQKIKDYYAANCATILQKAQSLYDRKKYHEAASYLSAISDALPCYEQASVLLKELTDYMPVAGPDTVIVERVVEKPVVVEKIVEKPVIVEKIVEKPVVVEKIIEKPVEQADPKVECEITMSTNRLGFKILKCYGNTTQQRITLQVELVNLDTNRNGEEPMRLVSAITDKGAACDNFEVQHGIWTKMPPRVKIRKEFYVTKVFDKFPSLSYVEMSIADTRVYIRNLPIQWD